jgi:NAD-dependent deacetylase
MIALATCEMFVSIGNAGAGEPGRSFLAEARRVGARALEFAREPTPLSPEFDDCIYGPFSQTVTHWIKQVIAS